LALKTGFHPGAINKAVIRRGFKPHKLLGGGNKLFLKEDEAERFSQQITTERLLAIPRTESLDNHTVGVYFIEIPSYSGAIRVKLGWSEKLSERLSTYRTIVPDLRVRAVWRTTDSWCERAALRCAEKLGKQVGQELFEFTDIESALASLVELFLKLNIPVEYPVEG
jgi:hypothetical protein